MINQAEPAPLTSSAQPADELMKTPEAAKYLDISPGTLMVWVSTHRYNIPFIKVGKNVRFRRSQLEAWLKSRERGMAVQAERRPLSGRRSRSK